MLQPPNRAPTIIDVARRAGVSKSTVSNVLQGKLSVDEDIRQRVQDAIEKLGYRPNAGARYLRQRSNALGVMVGDLRNPFHAEMAALIEEQAAARRHTILLATTGGLAEREVERVQALLEHRVAAVIFISFSGAAAALDEIGSEVPRIFVTFTGPGGLSIAVDDRDGARLAVEHLAKLGHRKIGYVSTILAHEPRSDAARFEGFRRGLAAHGLTLDPKAVLRPPARGKRTSVPLQDGLEALLTRRGRPTAFFAANDLMALELMQAADALGIDIPRDLSVVGFDDIALARMLRIQLTTISQPMHHLAERAVIAAIEGGLSANGKAQRNVKLAPELVVRDSTAPPHVS